MEYMEYMENMYMEIIPGYTFYFIYTYLFYTYIFINMYL